MGGGLIYGLLIHLGYNMWDEADVKDYVRCDETVWREITEHMAEVGANMLVIDLGEGLEYPSHPELAVKGTWSVAKMKAEVARLKGMGIEAIPKLNFSGSHDCWLKEYRRMHSTEEYYKVVSDIIRDVAETFGHPRFMHLGWDEEKEKTQVTHGRFDFVTIRQGDLWWHDMLFTAKEAKRNGMRPWIWSDKEWMAKDEFMEKCPRDIVQSQWYYAPFFGEERKVRDQKLMDEHFKKDFVENYTLCVFKELADAGFDQICCGSNLFHRNNFPDLVRHCLKTVPRERLLGFLNAPWAEVKDGDEWGGRDGDRGRYLNAVDQLAGARGIVERYDRQHGK